MIIIKRCAIASLISAVTLALSTLGAPAMSQTSVEASRDVIELAKRLAGCKDFRNDCQVCVRLENGNLGCSNNGIACSPSGQWRCSARKMMEESIKQ
jgi:hypothetical protein